MAGIKSKNQFLKKQGASEVVSAAESIHGMDIARKMEAKSTFHGLEGDDSMENVLASNSKNTPAKSESSAASTRNELSSKSILKNPPFQLVDEPAECFTGRDDILHQIHSRMKICATKNKWTERIVVLHGVEGIGKSELARQYAHLYRNDPIIQNTFWINAETFTSLNISFSNILSVLEPDFTSKAAEKIMKQVYKYFSKNLNNGLFIFDNAMQMRGKQMEILSFLPKQVMSHIPLILITSQFDQWQLPKENILKLDELTEVEAMALCLNYHIGLKRTIPETDLDNIRFHLEYLGCRPLTVLLTASSISMGSIQEFKEGFWILNPLLATGAEVAFYKVLNIILKKTTSLRTSQNSLKLLYTLAYLPPDQISMKLFHQPFCDNDWRLLEDYFLAKRTTNVYYHETIQIHRLVQDFTRKFLDSQNDYRHLFNLCEQLKAHIDLDNFENEAVCLHRHLKERNWSLGSTLYSIIFAAKLVINITNKPSAKGSAWEILQDVYSYLESNNNSYFLSVKRELILELLLLCLYYFSTNYEYCEDIIFKKIRQMGQNVETTVEKALETAFGLGQEPSLVATIGSNDNLVCDLRHRICETLLEYAAGEHTHLIHIKIVTLLLTKGAGPKWNTIAKVKQLYQIIWNYCMDSEYMTRMMLQYWKIHKKFYRTLRQNYEFLAYWEKGGPFPLKEIVEQLFNIKSNEDHDWDQKLKASFVDSFTKHEGRAILVDQMNCWIRKKYTSCETNLFFQLVAGLAFEWDSVYSMTLTKGFLKTLRHLTKTIFADDHNSDEIKVWCILTWFALFSKAKSISFTIKRDSGCTDESYTLSLEDINELKAAGHLNELKISSPKLRQMYIKILKSFLDLNSSSPESIGSMVAAHLLSFWEKVINDGDESCETCDEPKSMEMEQEVRLKSDEASFSEPYLKKDEEPKQELALTTVPVARFQQAPVHHNFTMTGIKSKNLFGKKKSISILPNPAGLSSIFQEAPSGACVIHGMDVAEKTEASSVFTGVQSDCGLEHFLAYDSRNASAGSGSSATRTRDPTLCYNLSGKGPGTVLILNNTFKKGDEDMLTALDPPRFEMDERKGSKKDVEVTKKLFEDMGCKVFKAENVKSTDLHQLLDNYKAKCKDSAFCIILVMTHEGGSKLSLLMEDLEEVDLWKQIVYPFSETNFKSFHGRPKIFFIQACATYNSSEMVPCDGVMRHGGKDPLGGSSLTPSGELADIFIGVSCLPYRQSIRNTVSGSWYIQSIHEIFSKCWRDEDLETMHTAVENSVVRKVKTAQAKPFESDEEFQSQTPYVIKMGFKKFYFSRD